MRSGAFCHSKDCDHALLHAARELCGEHHELRRQPLRGRTADAGDALIYYETYGEGAPFVVLHGGVGSPYEMGTCIDRLAESRRVIVPTARGHGRSGFGTEPYTFERKVRDVLAVLREEGVERAPVLGFSDGAYTALALAGEAPGAVEAVAAIGAGESVPGLRRLVIDYGALEALDPAYFAQQRRIMPEPDRWAGWMKETYEAFWNRTPVSKDFFMRVQCPTLLMAGELDGNAPLDSVIAAYRMIPHADLSLIAGAGHPCFLSDFPAVWAQIQGFFARGGITL